MNRLALMLAIVCVSSPLTAQRQWRLVEEQRMGNGDEPNSFGVVGSIAVAASGNIFVVDLKPLQIKLFSPAGAFIRAVGRTGDGPGEYRHVDGLLPMPDGNVMAIGRASGRVVVFTGDGLHVRTTPTTFISFGGGDWGGTLLADGSLLDPISVRPPNWQSTTRDVPRALQRILPNGTRGDTVRFPACRQQTPPGDIVVQIPQGRGYMQTRVPFLPFSQTVFASDGTAWCTPTDVYSVFHFRVGAPDTLHAIRLNVPAPAIPDSGQQRLRALLSRATNIADITVPTKQPVIADIRVDAANRLWVRRTDTPIDAPSFDLYDPQGKSLGIVTTTLRWHRIPLGVGEHAYGVVTGDDDVQYVVRARLR
jgi:hypothetical protein